MVLETDLSHGQRTPQGEHDHLDIRKLRRQQQRDNWDAYFKVMDLETKGTLFPRFRYNAHRFIDAQVSWFRENIAEPLQDRYKLPYYQRKFSRVPDIDECTPVDFACIWQANEQYRIYKAVDTNILLILEESIKSCLDENKKDMSKCAHILEQFEEAELNHFIKYGELGASQDARHCLMKQKHRMIWERRHPEIMAERERLYKEHKENVAQGKYDITFWRRNVIFSDKTYQLPYQYTQEKAPFYGDGPQSRDPQYYKEARQENKTGDEVDTTWKVRFWPVPLTPFKSGPKSNPQQQVKPESTFENNEVPDSPPANPASSAEDNNEE